ncbi:hypothetical protein MW335_003584 [Acinetobacter baumannii]|uniref:hypothetical protein n=1 Tax=Acinetobacter baumannii TaxID=470 RepID=UPI0038925710|nr:hypothetical protein [Acinetobacter baumannii]
MKPEQFIREFGEKKAREVVEGAPDHAEVYADITETYFKSPSCIYDKNLSVWEDMDRGMDLDLYEEQIWLKDLKRLVESLEIIETVGYDRDGAEEIYEFSKDCEVIHYAGLEIKVTRLAQAIKDHESIYGGGDE